MRLLDQQGTVEHFLRAYREHLKPGAYFFVGEVEGGVLRGIEEIAVRQEVVRTGSGNGVVFGFFEKGLASPPEAGNDQEHPLVHHVQATSPEFRSKLKEYLARKVEDIRSN